MNSTEDLGHHDWDQARGFLSRRLSRKLFRADQATLDDLTQEALVRLVRAARRETVLNFEGLMETIAERTLVDYLRSRRAWQKDPTIDPNEYPEHPGLAALPADDLTPSLERFQFAVLEFFQEHSSGCLDLAHHYFLERNWLEVARKQERPHTAIRQQWSRCVALLRKSAGKGAGWSWEWA
ncbi:MAG: sigma-70 family RNA polymerase sigma factor [bacterium]|jgi:DNA-directed RNA polymerase specialized sigma24 family protein|nr:sigma-70 family RNA polymerase sigma factor [bacterium]